MSNTRQARRVGRGVGVLAAIALLATACGDSASGPDAAPAATTTTSAPTTTTEATTTTTTEAVPDGTVAVTAVDYGFEGLPETVPTGSTFTLTNTSDTELHEMVLFQLSGYESRTLEEIVQLPPDELERVLGPPSAVILAPPGGEPSVTVVGDGRLRGTGRYAVFCFIPIGADPAEYLEKAATSEGPPEVDGGPPHFTAGMFAEVIVTGA